MEPISLAVGVVALYSGVIDILDLVKGYREFGTESQTTLLTFEASKLKLQNWATALGISHGKLDETHDPRLDDLHTAKVVKNILELTIKIFDKVEHTTESLKVPSRQRSVGTEGWILPGDDTKNPSGKRQAFSTRSRVAWATGGKDRLNKAVRSFEGLVNLLSEVVPPQKSGGHLVIECKASTKKRSIGKKLMNISLSTG